MADRRYVYWFFAKEFGWTPQQSAALTPAQQKFLLETHTKVMSTANKTSDLDKPPSSPQQQDAFGQH